MTFKARMCNDRDFDLDLDDHEDDEYRRKLSEANKNIWKGFSLICPDIPIEYEDKTFYSGSTASNKHTFLRFSIKMCDNKNHPE